jgi:hypothetical protein
VELGSHSFILTRGTLFKMFNCFGPLESGYLVDLAHLVDLVHATCLVRK